MYRSLDASASYRASTGSCLAQKVSGTSSVPLPMRLVKLSARVPVTGTQSWSPNSCCRQQQVVPSQRVVAGGQACVERRMRVQVRVREQFIANRAPENCDIESISGPYCGSPLVRSDSQEYPISQCPKQEFEQTSCRTYDLDASASLLAAIADLEATRKAIRSLLAGDDDSPRSTFHTASPLSSSSRSLVVAGADDLSFSGDTASDADVSTPDHVAARALARSEKLLEEMAVFLGEAAPRPLSCRSAASCADPCDVDATALSALERSETLLRSFASLPCGLMHDVAL